MDVSAAYRHCEQVVRTQARNFSYGIRMLPGPKRRALSAVYALARRIDDIGDGRAPEPRKLELLTAIRTDLRTLSTRDHDPVLVALADTARRYPIPLSAFEELIDGCEADVLGTSYKTFDDLVPYCRRVAGSVGRLSLGVFGTDDPAAAAPLADALGVALQLTNILRDIREDRVNGRVYLPAEDLTRFGCTLSLDERGRLGDPHRSLAHLIRFEADRTRQWYAVGLRLLPRLDRRAAACTGAMAGIYRGLLDRIAADPVAAAGRRTSLPVWEKAAVAVRALSGSRP